MVRYECKCCGCDFAEKEGLLPDEIAMADIDIDTTIVCPNCGAMYDSDEQYIEKYNK